MLPLTECGTSPDDNDEEESARDVDVGEAGGDDDDAHGRENGGMSSPSTSRHRVIRPHPNFRLFLTADPSCGEVSRAMRNRCVEVCLLDAAPAVAVVPSDEDKAPAAAAPLGAHGGTATTVATTEHVTDLLSLVRAAGLSDAAEATAAVATHSALGARRARGRADASAGEGPSPRSLLLWAKLAAASRARKFSQGGDDDVLQSCMPLAYPGLSPRVGSAAEDKITRATLAACLVGSGRSEQGLTPGGLLESLVGCGWKGLVENSAASRVAQGAKLLEIATAAGTFSVGSTGAARRLLSLVVDAGYAEHLTSSMTSAAAPELDLEAEDGAHLHSAADACLSSVISAKLLAQATALFARSASLADRHLRSVTAARLSSVVVAAAPPVPSFERVGVLAGDVGEAVSWMMGALLDSPASREASAMLSEMWSCGDARDTKIASVQQAASVARSRWAPADPRSNPDLFRSLQRTCYTSALWAPVGLLLRLVDASVGRRLPLLLAERAELAEASTRISSGIGGEAGLGWLGLSCLVSEGGRDSSGVGGGARCPETRLARSALAPYLLPLLRAVDGIVECLICRQAAESVIAEGGEGDGEDGAFLGAVREVLESRDTLSRLLCGRSAAPPNSGAPGADASAGGAEAGGKRELLFAWDLFLVSWQWLQQAVSSLRSVLSASSALQHLPNVSPALATLAAVAARVNAAVLQHAGGAEPTKDTLWKHGPRAAAPSSAAGAISLARIGRLADKFRILPATSGTSGVGAEPEVVSLGGLMREAHPAFCVQLDTRRELLHALCTLHWAASNEQADGPSCGQQPSATEAIDVDSATKSDDGSSLADRLPGVLEKTLESAKARFEAVHKGTRLGAAERQGDGLEHHQDDLEFGAKFDDFDTEAAEAVANATLLVVSGEGGGAAGADSAGGGGGGGVLQDWAVVQLSPLMEHWIAREESQILSQLADLDVSAAAASGTPHASAASQADGRDDLAALMARIARLRSAILATPSLSPAAARLHQTLLWAGGDFETWPGLRGPLLKRLLPVALDSFGRRLWENVVGTPGAFSLQLAPPEMVARSTANSGGPGGRSSGGAAADGDAFSGPVQLLTLARSSFLLRLLATPAFRGSAVPGYVGDRRTTMDLTLMNASARLGQFRAAMRGVRDLAYGGAGGGCSGGALKPLVQLAWARLCRTLGAFDGLLVGAAAPASEAGAARPPTFAGALRGSRTAAGDAADTISWDSVRGPLCIALEACTDETLTTQSERLVLPAAMNLVGAMEALRGPCAGGPTPRVEASAGLGMALFGCLRLVLLLPSSPVDPGLQPALEKELLSERMEGVKGELTVRRWSLVLEGGGSVSPEVCMRVVHLCSVSNSWCTSTILVLL